MKLISMKESKIGEKNSPGKLLDSKEHNASYPWGLHLNLNHDVLKKLGMKMPKVGTHVHIHAKAHVTSVSSNQHKGGEPNNSVELQIHHMAVGKGDPETVMDAVNGGIEEAGE